MDLVALLGEVEVEGVPTVIVWVSCVTLKGVLSRLLSSGKKGHKLVAWPCFPHREHNGVTLTIGVPVITGSSTLVESCPWL